MEAGGKSIEKAQVKNTKVGGDDRQEPRCVVMPVPGAIHAGNVKKLAGKEQQRRLIEMQAERK